VYPAACPYDCGSVKARTYPEHDNILYLTYLSMHDVKQRWGTFRNDAYALISLQNISVACLRRPSYVFFSTVQDQDGCHGWRLQGRNWKITQDCVKTGAAPRDNLSRRDLVTAFGRYAVLQYCIVLASVLRGRRARRWQVPDQGGGYAPTTVLRTTTRMVADHPPS
jgi:hypothetical protein